MKKSEAWLQLVNSIVSDSSVPCGVGDVVYRADQILKEFETRFGDVYEKESNVKYQPVEKDFG